MRIMIDARMGHMRVGIGVYVRGLLVSLSLIDKKNSYYIIVNKDKNSEFVPKKDNFHKLYTNISYGDYLRRDFWEQIYLPALLWYNKIDIYHGPNYVLPILGGIGMVLTAYDTISFATPEWYKPISRLRVQMLLKISAKKAHKIITGSERSKQDIIKILGVPDSKVKIIYIGIDNVFKPISDGHQLDSVKARYNIIDKFILYVGSINPRKNISRLIEAYNRLPAEILKEYQLVIAGRMGWKTNEVFAKVKQLGLKDRIVFTGFVADDDLPVLMNAAALLTYPSLYEGFGIPPLEAMACRTPVVASNTSSIPEVVGDAALLFDPYNVEDMTAAMHKALTDEHLREELRRKGLERIKYFSWEKAARETLAVYEEVYRSG